MLNRVIEAFREAWRKFAARGDHDGNISADTVETLILELELAQEKIPDEAYNIFMEAALKKFGERGMACDKASTNFLVLHACASGLKAVLEEKR